MHYLLISLLLVGCAFKGEDKKDTGFSLNGQVSRQAEVSWDSGSGSVKISRAVTGDRSFSIPDPVSLPPEIPDLLKITFNAPLVSGKLLQEPRVFISDVTDEKTVQPPVRLKGVLDPSGITIEGLQTFFAVNKQQKGALQISLRNAVTGDEEASLGIILISTPTSADIKAVQPGETRDQDLKKLVAPQLRLDLVFVFQIQNTNLFRTEFTFPGELHGSLDKDFLRHDFAQRDCSTDTGVVPWTEIYDTRFFVLPTDEDLPTNWVARLFDKTRVITLDPGESRTLGVYASGAKVSDFVDNGCPNLQVGSAQAIVGCHQVCGDDLFSRIREPGGPGPGRPCHLEPTYGSVPSGVETKGAYWVLDDASTEMVARNAFLNASDDPAGRTLHFLQPKQTIF
jgi:hypothetical protein